MPLSTLLISTFMSALIMSGVAGATSPVALANFTPRIENLPAKCQVVYERQISGCTANDFPPRGSCSQSCLQGLVGIQKAVYSECAGVNVPETSIIGVFMLGRGIPILCPGVVVTTVQSSATSQQQQQTSTKVQETTTTTSSNAQQTSAASASGSESQPQSSSTSTSTSSSGIAIDTTVPKDPITALPTVGIPPPSSASSAAQSTSTANSQKSNVDSGGGSPFDVVATGSSTALVPLTRLVFGVLLGAITLLHIAA